MVDSGSTHSFLDTEIAKELKVTVVKAPPLSVAVANGKKSVSHTLYPHLPWVIQGREIKEDLRVLQLGGYDMILGGDWMRKLNPITFDFDSNKLIIKKDGQVVDLQGAKEEGSLRIITPKRQQKLIHKKVSFIVGQSFLKQTEALELQNSDGIACCLDSEGVALQVSTQTVPNLTALIDQYEDIFKEPTSLPLSRTHDHRIPPLPNATPINIRQYRHSFEPKNEVEKLVKEMLATGIIQPSHSPFASPVLLVKKIDGTWKFCIDH